MTQIFISLLLTSVIGTFLALILTLMRPLTARIFSVGWHYYMWLMVLLVMIIPIRLNLPEMPSHLIYNSETATVTTIRNENIPTPQIAEILTEQSEEEQIIHKQGLSAFRNIKDFLKDNIYVFSFAWLTGIIILFVMKIVNYIIFLAKIRKHSKIISCPQTKAYTDRKIQTRLSNTICSPLMIGIIRPMLLLPEAEITFQQLQNVLAHEITHLRRNDVLYKWFVAIVKCIHWYNPAVYFICRQINTDCEISCDLAVVKHMDKRAEKEYIETILSLLTYNNSKTIPLTTCMTGSKRLLRKRFTMIKERQNTGKTARIISVVLGFLISVSGVVTSGVLATGIFEGYESEEAFDIEIRHNGYTLYLEDKPFIKNDTDTKMESLKPGDKPEDKPEGGIWKEKNYTEKNTSDSFIKTETPVNKLQQKEPLPKIKSTSISDEPYAGFERLTIKDTSVEKIQSILSYNGITQTQDITADLSSNYIVNDYTYKDSLRYRYNGVKCDNNGNISLFFSVNSDNLADVEFYDAETKEDVGKYIILANNENAYTFIGFDPQKTYDIAITGRTGNTWKIEGKHIIY